MRPLAEASPLIAAETVKTGLMSIHLFIIHVAPRIDSSSLIRFGNVFARMFTPLPKRTFSPQTLISWIFSVGLSVPESKLFIGRPVLFQCWSHQQDSRRQLPHSSCPAARRWYQLTVLTAARRRGFV